MKKKSFASFLFLIHLLGLILLGHGQNTSEKNEFHTSFDNVVGIENTGLLNGTAYVEEHKMGIEKTKFFLSRSFSQGSVVYNGQPYFNQEIQYNVYNDDVLIKLPSRLGGNTLRLVKENVERFSLEDYDFINLSAKDSEGSELTGFHEISFQSAFFNLFTKYTKSSFDRKDKGTIYYEFPFRENQYFLYYHNTYFRIKNKKDLAAIFPEHQQEIYAFYANTKSIRRSDSHQFMLALMNKLDSLIYSTIK